MRCGTGEPRDLALSGPPAQLLPEVSRFQRESVITIASFAGVLNTYGCSQTEISKFLQAYNQNHCTPPLPESEVSRIAESATDYSNVSLVELLVAIWSPHNPLNAVERAILWVLVTYSNWGTGECARSLSSVATSAGRSKATVKRTLPNLSSSGLISWVNREGKTNLYSVHVPEVLSLIPINRIIESNNSSTSSTSSCLDRGSQRAPPDTNTKQKFEDPKPPIHTQGFEAKKTLQESDMEGSMGHSSKNGFWASCALCT